VNLHRLTVFCTVVETGGLTAAGRQLLLSPSAVSMRLRALEDEVGQRLLQRQRGRLVPTPAGEIVYAYAVQAVRGAQDMRRALAELARGERGHLTVGVSVSPVSLILTERLSAFLQQHPHVQFTILADISERLQAMVLQGECDLAFTLALDVRPGLEQVPFYRDDVLLVVGPAHPLFTAPHVSVAELLRYRFVTGVRGHAQRAVMDAVLAANGLAGYPVAMELATAHGVRQAALSGAGIGIVVRSTVAADLEAGRLREIAWDHGPMTVEYQLVHRSGQQFSPLLRRVLDFLHQTPVQHPEAARPEPPAGRPSAARGALARGGIATRCPPTAG